MFVWFGCNFFCNYHPIQVGRSAIFLKHARTNKRFALTHDQPALVAKKRQLRSHETKKKIATRTETASGCHTPARTHAHGKERKNEKNRTNNKVTQQYDRSTLAAIDWQFPRYHTRRTLELHFFFLFCLLLLCFCFNIVSRSLSSRVIWKPKT